MIRRIAIFVLMVSTCGANAQDTGNQGAARFKASSPIGQNLGVPDGREGGETIEDAWVIPGLPFIDAGNTSDNNDDYDVVCPFGAWAPDVVYSFSPSEDGFVDLSLCSEGNEYDTKMYIYQDSQGIVIACNDDYCSNSHTYYASFLGFVPVFVGHTYFIVVDGYSHQSGPYELEMDWSRPCPGLCPENAVAEGEPPLVDWYVDEYNGGCNSDPPVFQEINWVNEEDGCAWVCGVTGWYYAGGSSRDTDWFPVVASGYQIDMIVTPEYETNIYFLWPTNCNYVGVVANATATPCEETALSYQTTPGLEVWLWVGPSTFSGPVNEYTYFLRVCGIQYDTVPTEKVSWGSMKEMYR